jgi:hypothetical protein
MPIKELQARNALPAEKPYKLADGGLFLLVQPNGSKLWRMKYRFAGKERLLSFGAYGQYFGCAGKAPSRQAHAVAGQKPDGRGGSNKRPA